MGQYTVSEAAREISRRTGYTLSPREISDAFYQRRLDDVRCPIVGRIRLIPADYIGTIEQVLREHGVLPPVGAEVASV